jgi:hypothetical protein
MKRCLIGALFVAYATASLAGDDGHEARHRPVRVFDANGHVIGDLTIFSAQNGVAFTVGNATAVVHVTRVQDASYHFSATDFKWIATSFAQYTSPDCSGDPIVNSIDGPRPAITLRQGNDVTVYFAAEGVQQSLTVRSGLNFNPPGCVTYAQPITISAYPAAAKLVISRDHPEPLRIGF